MPPREYGVPVPAMPMRVDAKSGLGQKERVDVLSALIAYRCDTVVTIGDCRAEPERINAIGRNCRLCRVFVA